MSTPSYAQNPLIPPGFGGVPLPPAIPAPVQRAFLIWVAIIAVNILGSLLLAFGDLGGIVGFVVSLVAGAVGVFLALHFRGGRNWARIVLTVLTGLAMLFALFGIIASVALIATMFAPFTGLVTLVVDVVEIGGGALALVYAWNKESSAYFARMAVA